MKPRIDITRVSRLVRDVNTNRIDKIQLALFFLTIIIASILFGSLAAAFAGAF